MNDASDGAPEAVTTASWYRSWHPTQLLVLFPLLWLLGAAATIQVEPYDGFDTILNTRFLVGDAEVYQWRRCPLLAILLIPSYCAAKVLNLAPLDVRPYHLAMAVLHAAVLVVTYRFVTKAASGWLAAALAFSVAMLNLCFFSFAPFISHDVLPGLFFLLMIAKAARFSETGARGDWWWLVALGAAAALVKQTYGLFWVAILVAAALPYIPGLKRLHPTPRRQLTWLLGGSVASAAIYCLVMGWVLREHYAERAYLARAVTHLPDLLKAQTLSLHAPVWIYLRNLHGYGVVTAVMIVPGIFYALKGKKFQQWLAVAWLLTFLAMHCIPSFREVRYIAFLMPLSAVLICEPLNRLLRHRYALLPVVAVALWDVGRGVAEASRVRADFYRHNPHAAYMNLYERPNGPRVVAVGNMMSAVPMLQSPFAADKYHRLFHFGIHHLNGFSSHEVNYVSIRTVDLLMDTLQYNDQVGAILPLNVLTHDFGWQASPPRGLEYFFMYGCVADELPLVVTADGSLTFQGKPVTVVPDPLGVELFCPGLERVMSDYVSPVAIKFDRKRPLLMVKIGVDRYRINGRPKVKTWSKWRFRGFRIVLKSLPAEGKPGLITSRH